MTILDAASARHGRRPWQRTHVERGIEEDDTLLGSEQNNAVATATLQHSDPDVWGANALVGPAAPYLHRLASLEPGRGLGAVMLGAAEKWARAAGAEVMRLDCEARNQRLGRYYLDLGYVPVREVEFRSWRMALLERRIGANRTGT
jgi:GNAT superfamily N-acetyltransferase